MYILVFCIEEDFRKKILLSELRAAGGIPEFNPTFVFMDSVVRLVLTFSLVFCQLALGRGCRGSLVQPEEKRHQRREGWRFKYSQPLDN